MKYSKLILSGSISLIILFNLINSCNLSKDTNSTKILNIHDEITVDEIQKAYQKGGYTIKELTQFYLNRIESLSFNGPELNAVITINPDAMEIAAQLDDEMRNGHIRGPLHGIPVLLKDNIDTGDKMPCTAGSRVMKDSYPPIDSPIAAQLRKAGAVILGKANMSEWANFHSTISSSGWSSLGGLTKNPYDLTRNPCGSSSGSAVAVAANLCVIAIGTETDGSIVCPANNCGIVGIKPTVGLISRTGIIPISFFQDTGGPMARNIKDAAICLGALTAVDSSDSKTSAPGRIVYKDYTKFLNSNGIKGKRIGFWKTPLNGYKNITEVMNETVAFFESQGATIIELEQIMDSAALEHSFNVLLYQFKDGLNKYLQNLGPAGHLKDLKELIEKTFADSIEMKYYKHDLFIIAQSKGNLDSDDYHKSLDTMLQLSRKKGIDLLMDEYDLDAIITPAGGPAWKNDLINGDKIDIYSASPAAIAGYPNIVVPMGQIDGLPVGLSIFGRAWSEPILLEIAYSYEQGTKKRQTPKYVNAKF